MNYETCVTQFTDKQLHNLLFSPLLLRAPGGVLSLRMLSVSWKCTKHVQDLWWLINSSILFQVSRLQYFIKSTIHRWSTHYFCQRLIINNGLQKSIIIYWGIEFGSRCAPLKSHNNHWLSIMLTGPYTASSSILCEEQMSRFLIPTCWKSNN